MQPHLPTGFFPSHTKLKQTKIHNISTVQNEFYKHAQCWHGQYNFIKYFLSDMQYLSEIKQRADMYSGGTISSFLSYNFSSSICPILFFINTLSA